MDHTESEITFIERLQQKPFHTPEEKARLEEYYRSQEGRFPGSRITGASGRSLITTTVDTMRLSELSSLGVENFHRRINGAEQQWRNRGKFDSCQVVYDNRRVMRRKTDIKLAPTEMKSPSTVVKSMASDSTARPRTTIGESKNGEAYVRGLIAEQNELLKRALEIDIEMRRYYFEKKREQQTQK